MVSESVTIRRNEKGSGWRGEGWEKLQINSWKYSVYYTSVLAVVLGVPSINPTPAANESFLIHQYFSDHGSES
jgi:hypothetical protein